MDQNEKEEKRKAWVRFRVMDVLRNHDQEARVIESQIAAERAALPASFPTPASASSPPQTQTPEW